MGCTTQHLWRALAHAAVAPLVLALSAAAASAELNIGAGSSFDFGDAAVDLGCSDLIVMGTGDAGAARITGIDNYQLGTGGSFDADTSYLRLSGDFAHSGGTFAPGGSTVAIVDGCGRTASSVTGSTTFSNFSVTTTTGKQLNFTAGATTTVNNVLELRGAPGNLLRIRSTSPGVQSFIEATVLQNIGYVDVADNHATGAIIAQGKPSNFNSVAGSNLFRWFEFGVAVPALSGGLLALLALMLATMPSVLRRRG